ncbi:MAG: hypothetical protein CM15mV8_0610 [Caudoviricetes sp.]|nr:MAG: hypothetical protein CM15mV8_0610 [Caudoviricetes sp.]
MMSKQYIKLGFDNKDTFDKFILDKETDSTNTKKRSMVKSFNITCDIQNKRVRTYYYIIITSLYY